MGRIFRQLPSRAEEEHSWSRFTHVVWERRTGSHVFFAYYSKVGHENARPDRLCSPSNGSGAPGSAPPEEPSFTFSIVSRAIDRIAPRLLFSLHEELAEGSHPGRRPADNRVKSGEPRFVLPGRRKARLQAATHSISRLPARARQPAATTKFEKRRASGSSQEKTHTDVRLARRGLTWPSQERSRRTTDFFR